MNVGRILLGWLAIGVMVAMIVAALMASGLISIHVETISDEEEDGELDLEEIKALDDSTWRNRLLKRLVRLYEKLSEREKTEGRKESEEK